MFPRKSSREPEPGEGDWTLEIHDRADGTVPYETFRASLDPYTRAALDISAENVLAKQGHNVCASPKFGRNLKRGLYEFKIGKSLATLFLIGIVCVRAHNQVLEKGERNDSLIQGCSRYLLYARRS
jgi:hypothetical protein